MSQIRVAIVEDQPLYRELVHNLIASAPGFSVTAAVGSLAAARASVDPEQIDVALLDLGLPDGTGLELGHELRTRNPRIGIVLLSAVDRMDSLLDIASEKQGGWSYLSKNASLSARELLLALRASAGGRTVLDRSILEKRMARSLSRLAALSSRQLHVLRLLAEGLTNASIAHELALSPRSVENHVYAIYTELSINRDDERNARVLATRAYLAETAPT